MLKIMLDNTFLLVYLVNMGKRGPKPEVDIKRAILVLRADNYTFEEIGNVFNFSRQRAHQLYKQSLEELEMSCQKNVNGVVKPS